MTCLKFLNAGQDKFCHPYVSVCRIMLRKKHILCLYLKDIDRAQQNYGTGPSIGVGLNWTMGFNGQAGAYSISYGLSKTLD